MDHFWTHLGTLGDLGGSKWTSKGSWKVFWTLPKPRPRKTSEKVIFRDPRGSTDLKRGLWASVRVLDTLGPKVGFPPARERISGFSEFPGLLRVRVS